MDGGLPDHVHLIIKQARLLHLATGLQREQEKSSPGAGTLFKPLLCHVSYCPLDQASHTLNPDQGGGGGEGEKGGVHLLTGVAAEYHDL